MPPSYEAEGALSLAASNGSAREKAPSKRTAQADMYVESEILMDGQPFLKFDDKDARIVKVGASELRSRLRVTVRGRVAAKDLKWVVRAGDLRIPVYSNDESTSCKYDSTRDVTYFTFFVSRLNNVGQTDTLKTYYEVSLRGVFTSVFGEAEIYKVWLDLSTQEQQPEVVTLDFQDFALENAMHALLPGYGTQLAADKSCVLSKAAICAAPSKGSSSGQQAGAILCKDGCLLSQTSTIQAPLATLLGTSSSQLVLEWTPGARTPVKQGVAQALSVVDRPCITLRDPKAESGLEFSAATSVLCVSARHSSLVPGMRYKCFLAGNRVWTKPWAVEEGQTGVTHVSEGDRQYLASQKDTSDILQPLQQRSIFDNGVVSLGITVLVAADGSFTADIDLSRMDICRQKATAEPEKAGLLALLCAAGAGTDGAKGAPVSLVLILVPESSAHPVVAFCLPTIRVAAAPTKTCNNPAQKLSTESNAAAPVAAPFVHLTSRSLSGAFSSTRSKGGRRKRAHSPSIHATAEGNRSSSDSNDRDAGPPAPPAKKVQKTGAGLPIAAPSVQPPSPALSGASSSGGFFPLGTSASTAPSASAHQPARAGKAVQAKKPAASTRTSSRASAVAGGSLPAVNLGKYHPCPPLVLPAGMTITPPPSPLHKGIIPELQDSWSEDDVQAASTGLELGIASPMAFE